MLQIRQIEFKDLPTATEPGELGFPMVQPEVDNIQVQSASHVSNIFSTKEVDFTSGPWA